jgi:hypothetical protein
MNRTNGKCVEKKPLVGLFALCALRKKKEKYSVYVSRRRNLLGNQWNEKESMSLLALRIIRKEKKERTQSFC